jgi:serine protease Do
MKRFAAGLAAQRVLVAGCGLIALAACNPQRSADASETRRTAVVKAVQSAGPCVVNIQGEKTVPDESGIGNTANSRHVNGMGSGVIIDARGYIITNHHVVDGVSEIQTTLSDGQMYVAKLVARDPTTDLAVIKVDAGRPLPVMELGTSSDLMAGESVIAVGNPFGYQNSVTRGIISALHRPVQISDDQRYEDLIQTDASINPGNSGGPLLNIDGQMIGINVAVRANAQGIGFAIPIDDAMRIATEMLSARRLSGIWHGLQWRGEPTISEPGVKVAAAESKSPAERAGFLEGDVVVAVGETTVRRPLDFERSLWS